MKTQANGLLIMVGVGPPEGKTWLRALDLPFPMRAGLPDDHYAEVPDFVVACFGPDVDDVLEAARGVYRRWPDARVLILRRDVELLELKRRMLLTPGLGINLRLRECVDPLMLASHLRELAVQAERNTRYKHDLNLANDHLRSAPVHLPALPASAHTLMKLLPVGVVALDSRSQAVFQNDAAREMGQGSGQGGYEPPWAEWPDAARQAVKRLLERGEQGQQVASELIAIPHPAAPVRHIELTAYTGLHILDHSVIVVLQDVSRRVNAELARSRFLANVSHEFRTPLNAILGFSEILRTDRSLQPEQIRSAQSITVAGEHLLELINNLLDLSRLEAETKANEVAAFNLHDMLQSVSDMISVRCQQQGLNWVLDAPVPEDCRVLGDAPKINRVLINLLGNAVKFTPSGEVQLRVRQHRQESVFEVIDTGIGIPYEEQDKVTQAFYRGSGAAHEAGAGLGLNICHRLLQLLDSRLELESKSGAGSRFSFHLRLPPVAVLETTDVADPREIPRLVAGRRLSVLVVDKDEVGRRKLASGLRLSGAEIREAGNGAEALALLKHEIPGLILLDLNLPDIDGLGMLHQLRQHPRWRGIPCVAMNQADPEQDSRYCLKKGFDGCLSKPLRFGELFPLITRLLGLEFEAADNRSNPDANAIEDGRSVSTDKTVSLTVVKQLKECAALANVDGIYNILRSSGSQVSAIRAELESSARRYDFENILKTLNPFMGSQDRGSGRPTDG